MQDVSLNNRKPVLGIMFRNFGPYHISRIAAAADAFSVVAIESNPDDAEYAWDSRPLPHGVTHERIGGGDARSARNFRGELDRIFSAGAPDAMAIPGWSAIESLVAIDWARRRSVPVIGMSDSNAFDAPRRAGTEALKRAVIRHYAAGFAAGPTQADYLADLGLERSAIALGYDVVDNDFFARSAEVIRQSGAMPTGVGLPQAAHSRYFLTVARFVEKKNLLRLVRAYARFRLGRSTDPADWPLVLIGDGEGRPAIEALVESLGLTAYVRLAGFRQVDELPHFYGTAGAFILPSTVEQWGLVVNEAMASGLPVAVSRNAGSVGALIVDGCGLTFDPLNEQEITAAMAKLADDPELRDKLTANGADRIAKWGLPRFVSGLRDSFGFAAGRGSHPRLTDRLLLQALIFRCG